MSEETITIPLSEYEALKKQNEELTQKIAYLLEEFNLAQKHRFGTSNEKTRSISAKKRYISWDLYLMNRKPMRMQLSGEKPPERQRSKNINARNM